LGGAHLDAGHLREVAVHAAHALDLAFGGKALIEAFHLERAQLVRPGAQPPFPALDPAVGRLGVLAREVGADADQRLQRHRPGDHVARIAPGFAPYLFRGLQEVAHDGVVAAGLLGAAAGDLDLAPVAADPAVQLVEELGLQDPLVLLTAAAEAVDAVAQRAVAFAVERTHHARRELAVGSRPRHALVQVDEVALVD